MDAILKSFPQPQLSEHVRAAPQPVVVVHIIREHHDGRCGVELLGGFEHDHAVAVRHLDVENHQVGPQVA